MTARTSAMSPQQTLPTFTPVRSGLLQRKCACGGSPGLDGECEECRKKRLRRKVAQPSTLNDEHSEVPPIVHDVLRSTGQPLDANTRAFMEPCFRQDFSRVPVHAAQSGSVETERKAHGQERNALPFQASFVQPRSEAKLGQEGIEDEDKKIEQKEGAKLAAPSVGKSRPLPEPVKTEMETAFQADFSDVRIHEDSEAGRINAIAYTRGSDVHFAIGKYDPWSQSGRQLLGHELTHVIQQRTGRVPIPQAKDGTILQDLTLEMEADLLGARAERRELVSVQGTTSGGQGKAARSSKRVVQRAAIAWDTVGYTSDAGADNSSTTEKDFNITYKASEDKTKTLWKLQVDSVKGGADIEMHTDAWRDAFATPPTTEAEAKAAVTDMKGYYNRGSAGSWHTEDASRAHEEHHYKEWKCSAEHYWPKTEKTIEKLTAPKATYATEADAITALRAGVSGADNKMKAFKDKSHDYWFTLSDAAKSRPYAAGQKVLNKAIQHVQTLAATNKWTVSKGTSSPSDANPCYKAWLGYSP